MKRNTVRGLLMAMCLGAVLTANAQTTEQKAEIRKHNNSEALQNLSKKLKAENAANYAKALELAEINGWPLRFVKDGVVAVLSGVRENGKPIYKGTSNKGGARTARVNNIRTGGILGLDLNGQDMTIGMWEIGSPRKNHNELTSARVTNEDGSSFSGDNDENFHATHVAGTLIGSGSVDSNARGMAYQADLEAYDSGNDISEVADAADDGLLISNHSYGLIFEFAENWEPGAYTIESALWDEVMFDAPYYQAVMAAGNDRTGEEKDELLQEKTAKNAIIAAAVYELPTGGYTDADDVQMSSFSTYGPTDDKRIKPDISAKGVEVWSCAASSNSAHAFAQGTSMASPGIAGTLTLFQQHYNNLHDEFMRAATLKGLMTHTADEAGDNPGPDFRFGWGLINATKAVLLMSAADQGAASTALIEENTLNQSAVYSFNVNVNGTQPLKATIAWTDRATNDSVNDGTSNSTTPVLTNDLDLRITRVSDGEVFLPWRLNPIASQGAVKADNEVDNVEVVEILTPQAGTYTITVNHKGNLASFSPQKYSLIVDSFIGGTAGVDDVQLSNMLSIYPNPATDVINISVDASVNTANGTVTMYDLQGRQVKQFNSFVESINVSDLSSGVYMLSIKADGATATKKVIVK